MLTWTLRLPRILCLHGGGTNARIFHAQCRILRAQLKSTFRLIFADGSFPSPPGPDVESVYADWGPFRSWVQISNGRLDLDLNLGSIDASIAAAVDQDDRLGATGVVVGLLGFSQGARIAASLLLRKQQKQKHQEITGRGDEERTVVDPCFAVLLAGRGPLLCLDPAAGTGTGGNPKINPGRQDSGSATAPAPAAEEILLRLPTIHVHGLRDPGIEAHRDLLRKYCDRGSTTLVEWDGDHRVPIRTKDVAAVVAQVLQLASNVGVD
ncbi:hypothetical protein DV738_g1895, partial [Chaetothyriales sp. CBS 135597]